MRMKRCRVAVVEDFDDDRCHAPAHSSCEVK